jgi:hypothetical protein
VVVTSLSEIREELILTRADLWLDSAKTVEEFGEEQCDEILTGNQQSWVSGCWTLRPASFCRPLGLQIPFWKQENKQHASNDCEIAKGGFLADPRARLPHEEPFAAN